MFRHLSYSLALMMIASLPIQASDSIAITVYDFPPDIVHAKSNPSGPLVIKMQAIMGHAGLTITWIQSSLGEEAVMLNDGVRPFCTTGRFFSHMRVDEYGWVFLPYILHNLGGDVILVHMKNQDRFKNYDHVSQVFEDSSLTGVFIKDVSYGSQMDNYLNKYPERFNRTAVSTDQVIAMVASGRGDYGIVSDEFWRDRKDKNLQFENVVNLGDQIDLYTSERVDLYLACSRAVPLETLARIETAMKKLNFKPTQEQIRSFVE